MKLLCVCARLRVCALACACFKKKAATNSATGPPPVKGQEQRPKIVAANPTFISAEVSRALGAAWKKLSDTAKAKYLSENANANVQRQQSGNAEGVIDLTAD